MQDFNQALAFCNALTGNQAETTIFDFRAIHDQRKDIPAIPFRGTLNECWQSITHYNSQGYGCFAVINQLDGQGRDLANVQSVRAHFVDLDNLSAMENLKRAGEWYPAPSFAVQSSPNKAHVYWPVLPYQDNDRFTLVQRKLNQFFDADKRIIDATRVMRLPGTFHQKGEPVLVTCWSLNGFGYVSDTTTIETNLAHVNVIESFSSRHELGDAELAAPSLEWLKYTLQNIDPNDLDRGDWISFSAAFKQSGWSLADPDTLFQIWSEWCGKYEFNDVGENLKQWNSIKETQVGWKSIMHRVPAVAGQILLAEKKQPAPSPNDTNSPQNAPPDPIVNNQLPNAPQKPTAPPMPVPEMDCKGELLTDIEQKQWFKDCVFIERFGQILTPSGRMMNATAFNGAFGGKKFIIDEQAKVVNEPWQAALRSTLWTVPKADHIRFLPHKPYLDIDSDELGRKGVNTYKPALITSRAGDATPFLNHLAKILPVQSDQKILLDFFAHNIKYPGHKIPWAPLIQSAEGVGKGVFKAVMRHAMGGPYVYWPKAKEMAESGSKFNAWMRAKLFILVDEVRTDERRDMIEILKDFISEKEIEIQGKGSDQDKEDNYSNWMFFSNWKDAIPVNKNGRRFSINYSVLQSAEQILNAGMNDDYFNWFFTWLETGGGLEIVTDYFLNYQIERGAIPMRAPVTSSTVEALRQSRGPLEQLVIDAIDDQLPGFRGGYVSAQAVVNRIKASGARSVSPKTIAVILESLGMVNIGRAARMYIQEDINTRSQLYHMNAQANINDFGRWQGYE